MGLIKERYCKTDKLHGSQTFYYLSTDLSINVNILWREGMVFSSKVETLRNVLTNPYQPFYIKQEPGNSTKEEFDRMLKLAIEHK